MTVSVVVKQPHGLQHTLQLAVDLQVGLLVIIIFSKQETNKICQKLIIKVEIVRYFDLHVLMTHLGIIWLNQFTPSIKYFNSQRRKSHRL